MALPKPRPSRRSAVFSKLFLPALVLAVVSGQWLARAEGPPSILLAAGDIGVCKTRGAQATAKLLDHLAGTIIVPGDLAYPKGSAKDFRDCYDPTWGRHKARTWPVPGNHEYEAEGAAPYYDYWGKRAGEPGRGYYSFELGPWHIVALNSNIDTAAGSEQERWLRADLATTKARCILGYWHHPVFSAGKHGDQPNSLPLFRALYDFGASVLLTGHDHDYERFAPMDSDGVPNRRRGLRSFTVGTGGARLYKTHLARKNSEFWDNKSWGILRLALFADRYEWAFLTVDGQILDAGAGACVGPFLGDAQQARKP